MTCKIQEARDAHPGVEMWHFHHYTSKDCLCRLCERREGLAVEESVLGTSYGWAVWVWLANNLRVGAVFNEDAAEAVRMALRLKEAP